MNPLRPLSLLGVCSLVLVLWSTTGCQPPTAHTLPPVVSPPPAIPGFAFLKTEKHSAGGLTLSIHHYRHEVTGVEFSLIPGGEFQMGSPQSEGDRESSEGPQRKIQVKPFLISRHEITQKTWYEVMKTKPWNDQSNVAEGPRYPVVYVSWYDARDFCKKIEWKLPSEIQWEYAARGGTTTRFFWGDKMNGEYAWYEGNASKMGARHASVVGDKKANPFGLYDMMGNVHEWCRDDWHPNYSGAPSGDGPWEGGKKGTKKVIRGGSWSLLPRYLRSASRSGLSPSMTTALQGFRCVVPLPESKKPAPTQ